MNLHYPIIINMSKYLAFFQGAFRSQIRYRLATVMGFLVSALLLLIQYCLWGVLIGSGVRQNITLTEMITYVVITQVADTLTRGNFANEIGTSIRDGSVVMHFIRPASYQLYLFSTNMGQNCYKLFTQALPVVILSALLVGLSLPPSITHFLLFLVFSFLGIIIMFELIYITGLLAFWTQAT